MLKYKGYTGWFELDSEAKIFHGEVFGTRDVITFQGRTAEELEHAFRDSVDDYLAFCRERGESPDKPYSGKLNLRLPKELHKAIAALARAEGISLNDLIVAALQRRVQRRARG
ncbi:MAG TPA: type II toxin-antitoxin system HicB family antitoxin [Planctomycetota bacterium]|jgi:predicted HicB family RNase H-like nuclease